MGQQFERSQERLTLAVTRMGHAQRTAMWRQDQAGQAHGLQPVPKDNRSNHHRSDAGLFQQTGDVSHGHVTDRSERDEYSAIDFMAL